MDTPADDNLFAALAQELSAEGTSPLPPARPANLPAKPQILDLSYAHEAIMNWMIANPQMNLAACAAEFGYTRSWLSTIIHSNCFQARLKEKQDQVFNAVKGDLAEKLAALADVGVEKLQEKMETSEDPRFIKETTEMALKTLGFGQKTASVNAPQTTNSTTNVQQNIYVASQADLVAARKMLVGGSLSLTPQVSPPAEATLISNGLDSPDQSFPPAEQSLDAP